MALTDDEKARIRMYLGYSDVNRQLQPGIEAAMNAVSAEGEVLIREILTKLAQLDATIASAQSTFRLKRAEDVEFFEGSGSLPALYAEGERCVNRLAAILGVPVLSSSYAPSSGGAGLACRG